MELINVNQMIEDSKMSKMQWKMFFAAMIIIIFDGYDLVIYGVTLPFLMNEWSLTPISGGIVASITLIGMMIGAVLFGTLSDKLEKSGYSRKKVIIFCLCLFSIFSALCGFAKNIDTFTAFRFISGLGLGGVMPNIIALVSEYAPKKLKATLITIMFSGYAIGGVLAALLGNILISDYGWHIMYMVAIIPFVVCFIFIRWLPESIDYLVRVNQYHKAKMILSRMNIKINPSATLTLNENNITTVDQPFLELFKNNRASITILFWCCAFMCLVLIYGLSSWLPKLMLMAGYDFSKSLTFLLALNIGAIIGSFCGGILGDRFGLDKVLFSLMFIGAISLYLLSYILSPELTYILIGLAGAAAFGGQNLLLAYIAQFYDSNIRATGIGYTLAIGRLGAISGPFLGGWLLNLALPLSFNFIVLAIPCFFAMVCIALLMIKKRKEKTKILLVKSS